ncbi:hypothetical protein F383_30442 [Gossypium arboreum]|uniref:Uncharacterized protein n=1 Tax=Gossypium arboreum TaxID=29729 RepID=A0A0B0PKH1_GOSAR|nr:hypothetical protein F383_30442 [Gossypium arboreum]
MKDIIAIGSSGIVKNYHYTIKLYFGMTFTGWQFGLANGLFLPTRAETWACVSVVLLEGHFEMSLSRPHYCIHERVLGYVSKSVSTTGLIHGRVVSRMANNAFNPNLATNTVW